MDTVLIGFATAVSFFIIMWKINLEFFAKYHWQTDLIISVTMAYIFFGTFSGMSVAVVSGIFLSFFLWLSRKSLGY
jgi:hypothetical protein